MNKLILKQIDQKIEEIENSNFTEKSKIEMIRSLNTLYADIQEKIVAREKQQRIDQAWQLLDKNFIWDQDQS